MDLIFLVTSFIGANHRVRNESDARVSKIGHPLTLEPPYPDPSSVSIFYSALVFLTVINSSTLQKYDFLEHKRH
jgi:hypothetical protein